MSHHNSLESRRFEDAVSEDESEGYGNPNYDGRVEMHCDTEARQTLAEAGHVFVHEGSVCTCADIMGTINPAARDRFDAHLDRVRALRTTNGPSRTDFVMDSEGNILTAQPPPREATLPEEPSQFQVNMEAAMRRSRALITRMFVYNTPGLDNRLPTRAHVPKPKTAPPIMMEEDEAEPTSEPARACYVCYVREACWVPPCNHIACKACLLKLKLDEKSCPKCREPITNIKKIFF